MKTFGTWNFRPLVGKIAMVLVLASMVGSIEVTAAIARDNDEHGDKHDNGRHEDRGRGHEGDRGRHHGRREIRPAGYGEPVYVPPPVYYAPPPEPGISIFLPSIHIR